MKSLVFLMVFSVFNQPLFGSGDLKNEVLFLVNSPDLSIADKEMATKNFKESYLAIKKKLNDFKIPVLTNDKFLKSYCDLSFDLNKDLPTSFPSSMQQGGLMEWALDNIRAKLQDCSRTSIFTYQTYTALRSNLLEVFLKSQKDPICKKDSDCSSVVLRTDECASLKALALSISEIQGGPLSKSILRGLGYVFNDTKIIYENHLSKYAKFHPEVNDHRKNRECVFQSPVLNLDSECVFNRCRIKTP